MNARSAFRREADLSLKYDDELSAVHLQGKCYYVDVATGLETPVDTFTGIFSAGHTNWVLAGVTQEDDTVTFALQSADGDRRFDCEGTLSTTRLGSLSGSVTAETGLVVGQFVFQLITSKPLSE